MKGNEINKKLILLKENKKPIHIRCNSGRFYNGTILEINFKKKYVILIDSKIGELPILFEEILYVEPFKGGEKWKLVLKEAKNVKEINFSL